ncbi:hypothetical protein B296_00009178 [Ensete ventricosum]|uniref:Uncharacterized protein n=1 Tax=Ensete ventricosum TaxID=4639 RepID=A0A427AY63_ENSVE|nr:hypothetical protein B296_00009178 [Ensete ventricosum]
MWPRVQATWGTLASRVSWLLEVTLRPRTIGHKRCLGGQGVTTSDQTAYKGGRLRLGLLARAIAHGQAKRGSQPRPARKGRALTGMVVAGRGDACGHGTCPLAGRCGLHEGGNSSGH